MARQIEAYKLRTELAVDARQGTNTIRTFQRDVDKLGDSFKKAGKTAEESFQPGRIGRGFKSFTDGARAATSATALLTGSIDSLGQTIGSILGTAMAPGLGTAIGSTIGSGVDLALSKATGVIVPLVQHGIALNKEVRKTIVEFKTFTGSEKEAIKYLDDLQKLAIDTGTNFSWIVETSEKVYDLTGNLELTSKILKAAADQAADFGGEAETIGKVAEALGLIAEKGELASREINKLYKLGINAKQLLSEATGLSEKRIEKLMAAGRIRGDVAARLIAEGIERQKGGFAERLTTEARPEARFQVLLDKRVMEGTRQATKRLDDLYRAGNRALGSDTAGSLVNYLDQTAGKLFDLTETGIQTGINATYGVAEGITSSQAYKAVSGAITDFSKFVTNTYNTVFESKSPSELMAREVGVPIGMGIAEGVSRGFMASFGQTTDDIVRTLETLLQDPRILALLETIRTAEGGAPGRIVGYGGTVTDLSRHPNKVGLRTAQGPSTAAGNYQITGTTWRAQARRLGLPDFGEHSQALAALGIMVGRGGLGILQGGSPEQMMRLAALDWSSTPGQKIGGGKAWDRSRWLRTYNQKLAGITGGTNGVVPVAVVQWATQDIQGGAQYLQQNMLGGGFLPNVQAFQQVIEDTVPVVVDVVDHTQELIKNTYATDAAIVRMTQIVPRSINALTVAEVTHAKAAIKVTKQYQEASREQLVMGISFLTQIGGAVSQLTGFVPSQTVGKKRSLWSKILGVAAPFLSFIPGVGGILSTIAGTASAGLGGNWAGVVSGVAGGLQSWGNARSAAAEARRTTSTTPPSNLHESLHARQYGGPVYTGRTYLVGEAGPEMYTPTRNGYITPGGDLLSVAAELRAAVQHLHSLPPNQVVMRGARGLVRAMDHDAGLIRLVSQRQRLS